MFVSDFDEIYIFTLNKALLHSGKTLNSCYRVCNKVLFKVKIYISSKSETKMGEKLKQTKFIRKKHGLTWSQKRWLSLNEQFLDGQLIDIIERAI